MCDVNFHLGIVSAGAIQNIKLYFVIQVVDASIVYSPGWQAVGNTSHYAPVHSSTGSWYRCYSHTSQPWVLYMQENFTYFAGFCCLVQDNFDPLHSSIPKVVWREFTTDERGSLSAWGHIIALPIGMTLAWPSWTPVLTVLTHWYWHSSAGS